MKSEPILGSAPASNFKQTMYDCYYNFHNNLSYSVHVGKLLHCNFDVVEDKDEYNFQFSTIKV